MRPQTLEWLGGVDGHLRLIDQTRLPGVVEFVDCRDVATLWHAIKTLQVRGAPAIGVSAAYGVVLAAQASATTAAELLQAIQQQIDYLATSRPTAVNLFWALERMRSICIAATSAVHPEVAIIREVLLREARAIDDEDRRMCRAIGAHGAALLADGDNVLTHCNAGGLATSDYGTALAVFFSAHEAGKRLHVWVDETRPLWQGARLTAWELVERGIPATLICDSMAAHVMREKRIRAVVVGADRIAANGDTANKIGTYSVALAAAAHNIPFYVAAPTSTFDLALASGAEIPIEERAVEEVTTPSGTRIAPAGIGVYNPAFDVTPAALVRAIICERGIISPVTPANIANQLGPPGMRS